MLGIGVMLGQLSGNADSVTVFSKSIGKRIASVTLGEDDALHFLFTDGSKMKISDEGQSCCEHRYMTTDDDLTEFTRTKLLGAVIKKGPSVVNEFDEHEIEFLEVQTDKGVFTMASHNEHNGYYGGFYIRASEET